MVARTDMPPHARADSFGRGHRFAAYPRCSTDLDDRDASDESAEQMRGLRELMTWLKRPARVRQPEGEQENAQLRGPGPPPPDTSAPGGRVDEEDVAILYSATKTHRVVIGRDRRGLYRVHEERWDTGDWDIAGAAYWCPYDQLATITDTIENAEKLAREALAQVLQSPPSDGAVEQADAADEAQGGTRTAS
jgi:hypothetical protein